MGIKLENKEDEWLKPPNAYYKKYSNVSMFFSNTQEELDTRITNCAKLYFKNSSSNNYKGLRSVH